MREQLFAGAGVVKLFSTGGGTGAHPNVAQLTEEETRAAVDEAHKHHLRVATHAHATSGMRVALTAGVDTIEHATLLDSETIRLCKEKDVALVPTFAALRAIVRHVNASIEEALRAATSVAAGVLGRDDVGRIREGARRPRRPRGRPARRRAGDVARRRGVEGRQARRLIQRGRLRVE